jgi:hypothetical protein
MSSGEMLEGLAKEVQTCVSVSWQGSLAAEGEFRQYVAKALGLRILSLGNERLTRPRGSGAGSA